MNIHGLTVCVGYADRLRMTVGRWLGGLDSLTVITDLHDRDTLWLAHGAGCRVYQTDAFTRHGAAFNKGAAIEGGRLFMPWSDWVLFFDPDIMPPEGWKRCVEAVHPTPGRLYGCRRFQGGQRVQGDAIGVGFFQLFHSSDPRVCVPDGEDLIETHWTHAGNYDNAFMHRWPDADRVDLGFHVEHLGERGNWWGPDSDMTVERMEAERRLRGGRKDHEKIGTQQARRGAVPGSKH